MSLPVPRKARARARSASSRPRLFRKKFWCSAARRRSRRIESWLTEVKGQRVRILRAAARRTRRVSAPRAKNAEQNLKAFLAHQEVQETRPGPRAHRTRRRARASRAAASHRVLRHLEHPRHQPGRLDGRVRRGAGEEERLPQFQDSIRHGPNDFAMMQETLRRRLRYLRARPTRRRRRRPNKELAKKEKFNKKPDLLLIDGGKGQLERGRRGDRRNRHDRHSGRRLGQRARVALRAGQSGPDRAAAELAGSASGHAHSRRSAPLRHHLSPPAARQGDDAIRARRAGRRRPGAPKTALGYFGSVAAIKRASVDEIAAVKGMTPALAAQIKTALEGGS